MPWGVTASRTLAGDRLRGHEPRWSHVRSAGELAEELVDRGLVDEVVASAAWLHDVGYSPDLVDTGLHALDGACYLASLGAPDELVALVAHHTGAGFEAEERGLAETLNTIAGTSDENLEALTLIDLVVGPYGTLMDPGDRVAEILSRYRRGTPVFQAVARSTPELLRMAMSARSRMCLPDGWPLLSAQQMAQVT